MSDHAHGCRSEAAPHAHHPTHGFGGALVTSFHATLHCLTGCVIGEVAGLMIGVSLGLPAFATIALATGLAYLTGMTLGLVPVMRRERIGMLAALRIISSSNCASDGFSACGSILIEPSVPSHFAITFTAPPPLVASTVRAASAACVSSICR